MRLQKHVEISCLYSCPLEDHGPIEIISPIFHILKWSCGRQTHFVAPRTRPFSSEDGYTMVPEAPPNPQIKSVSFQSSSPHEVPISVFVALS